MAAGAPSPLPLLWLVSAGLEAAGRGSHLDLGAACERSSGWTRRVLRAPGRREWLERRRWAIPASLNHLQRVEGVCRRAVMPSMLSGILAELFFCLLSFFLPDYVPKTRLSTTLLFQIIRLLVTPA